MTELHHHDGTCREWKQMQFSRRIDVMNSEKTQKRVLIFVWGRRLFSKRVTECVNQRSRWHERNRILLSSSPLLISMPFFVGCWVVSLFFIVITTTTTTTTTTNELSTKNEATIQSRHTLRLRVVSIPISPSLPLSELEHAAISSECPK